MFRSKGKSKIIRELKKASKEVQTIYLGPDPDCEGEAIAWHIAEEIGNGDKRIYRVLFNEITKKAVLDAIRHPGKLQQSKYEAQQARRILDRIVGYKLSPLLWKKVARGLSAGRVQSVAVKLIVQREREIRAFVPEEYWSLTAQLEGVPRRRFPRASWRPEEQKSGPGTSRRPLRCGPPWKRGPSWSGRCAGSSAAATPRRRSPPPNSSRMSKSQMELLTTQVMKEIAALLPLEYQGAYEKIKIEKAEKLGLCFGVRRAIKLLKEAANKYGEIETLGPVAHNRLLVEALANLGVKPINNVDHAQGKILAITTHGASPAVLSEIKSRHIRIIDTTCPIDVICPS
jgi:hypothetical protein